MLNGAKHKFKLPRVAQAGNRRSSRNAEQLPSNGKEVEDSAVIEVFSTEAQCPPLHQSEQDLYTVATDEEDVSPWPRSIDLSSHGYYQWCNIQTAGAARTKPHHHTLGLTQVIFNNCMIQVRPGEDLEKLLAKSIDGPVRIINVRTNGWAEAGAALLPAFVFHRWLSHVQLE